MSKLRFPDEVRVAGPFRVLPDGVEQIVDRVRLVGGGHEVVEETVLGRRQLDVLLVQRRHLEHLCVQHKVTDLDLRRLLLLRW